MIKDHPFTTIIEQMTTALVETTAIEFKKWMRSSDAPTPVKAQFEDAILDINDRELGVIVLSASNWIAEIKA